MTHNRPNLIWIVLDTTRRDHLSSYCTTRLTSPHFDAFATDHVKFERAIAAAQWTIPSHTSMFTGLYPGTHGVTQANSVLSGMYPTIAEILAAGGYHTVAFCNNPLVGVLNNGLQRGFERFFNYASAIPNRPYDEDQHPLYREFVRRFRPTARKMGNSFSQSDTLFRLALNPLFVPLWSKFINFKGNTAHSVEDFNRYWRSRRPDQPLFAFVNFMNAHLPYQPPQDVIDRLAPEVKADRRAYAFIRRLNADGAAWASPPDQPLADWQIYAINAFYDAEIAAQDEQLGRLLDSLRGDLAETAVIITADHGDLHGEHEYMGHGFSVHQELVHVPLAMHIPGMDAARINTTVSTRRIFHTLIDLANVPHPLDPDDANADIRSLSLINAIRGADTDVTFSEAVPPMTFVHVLEHRGSTMIERLQLRQPRRAVFEGDFKLVMIGDGDAARVEALYNLAADPGEQRDLTSDPAYARKVETMRRLLDALMRGVFPAQSATADVDASVMEQLRALGYVD